MNKYRSQYATLDMHNCLPADVVHYHHLCNASVYHFATCQIACCFLLLTQGLGFSKPFCILIKLLSIFWLSCSCT